MAKMKQREYTIGAVKRAQTEVTLGDFVFVFTPPKKAVMVMSVLDAGGAFAEGSTSNVQAMFEWLEAGMEAEDYATLQALLRDPDHALDVDDLTPMIRDLIADSTARPS